MSKHLFRLAASSVLMAGLVDAHAGLSLRPPQNFPGSGLGAANVILTLQNIPGFSFEAGSVGRAVGIPGDVISGDVQAGASRTRTRSLRDLGIASAADLRVVFAPLEPAGGADEGISLNNLQLSIFSPSGTLLFNSGFFSPVSFADTVTGGGDSGFVFALDGAQVGEAQAAAFGSGFAGDGQLRDVLRGQRHRCRGGSRARDVRTHPRGSAGRGREAQAATAGLATACPCKPRLSARAQRASTSSRLRPRRSAAAAPVPGSLAERLPEQS